MLNKNKKVQDAPVAQGPGVSELLKLTRERGGADLQGVSQVLRIRYVYLEAIEEGRFEDLPGKTYVVGFVRAYAEYLGLDAEEVVRRFKEEIAGMESKAELVFPSPVTEQSVPGGAVILISLIILGAAYGGWYFLSSQDRSMAELVPDLPAKFSEMVEKVKGDKKPETGEEEPAAETATTSAPETEAAESAEPVTETDTQDMAAAALQAVEKAEEEAQAASEDQPVEEMETVKVEDLQEAAEEETAVAEKVEEVVTPVAETVEETVAEVVEETVEEVAPAVETAQDESVNEAPTPAEETPTEVVEEEETGPAVMDEVILIKAIEEYAWIQVVDGKGVEQHTQSLEAGEEYQIPAVQGLVLRTGNAGGLEIYVDGQKAPMLGEIGDVLRHVNLDPAQLLAGKAVEN